MNLFTRILSQLPLLPGIIQGIQVIHGEAGAGATRKQMAMDALGLAGAVAGAALPEFAPEVQAATSLASGAIDLIVAGFNKVGWSGHGVSPILPVAIPTDTKTAKPLRQIG